MILYLLALIPPFSFEKMTQANILDNFRHFNYLFLVIYDVYSLSLVSYLI
jgi:hypothetical protein